MSDTADLFAEKAAATQEFDTDDDRELWQDGFAMGYATGVAAIPDGPVVYPGGQLLLTDRLRKNSKVFGDMFKDSSLLLDAAAAINRLEAELAEARRTPSHSRPRLYEIRQRLADEYEGEDEDGRSIVKGYEAIEDIAYLLDLLGEPT